MAVTTDPYTASDLAPVIQEVWADILQEPRFADGTLINWATDLSEFMAEGADIAHVPGIYTNQFSVQSQSTQGAEVTTEAVAATDTTLTVDTHRHICACKSDQIAGTPSGTISSQALFMEKVQRLLSKMPACAV